MDKPSGLALRFGASNDLANQKSCNIQNDSK